ncbi:hypothetical protein HDV06_005484 [Boothiomyces sp. JEL0866]|nr:hypothetical protein HDV06_005484 [Boothiomyces sp. JEL0866]
MEILFIALIHPYQLTLMDSLDEFSNKKRIIKNDKNSVPTMPTNMTALHTPEYTSDEDFDLEDFDEEDEMLDQLLEVYQNRVQKIETEMQQLRSRMDILEMEKISFRGRETELLRIIDVLSNDLATPDYSEDEDFVPDSDDEYLDELLETYQRNLTNMQLRLQQVRNRLEKLEKESQKAY